MAGQKPLAWVMLIGHPVHPFNTVPE